MLRWPDYFADPPSDTTSGDVNHVWPNLKLFPANEMKYQNAKVIIGLHRELASS